MPIDYDSFGDTRDRVARPVERGHRHGTSVQHPQLRRHPGRRPVVPGESHRDAHRADRGQRDHRPDEELRRPNPPGGAAGELQPKHPQGKQRDGAGGDRQRVGLLVGLPSCCTRPSDSGSDRTTVSAAGQSFRALSDYRRRASGTELALTPQARIRRLRCHATHAQTDRGCTVHGDTTNDPNVSGPAHRQDRGCVAPNPGGV